MASRTPPPLCAAAARLQVTTARARAESVPSRFTPASTMLVILKTANSAFRRLHQGLPHHPARDQGSGSSAPPLARPGATARSNFHFDCIRVRLREIDAPTPSPTTSANLSSRRSMLWPKARSTKFRRSTRFELTMPNAALPSRRPLAVRTGESQRNLRSQPTSHTDTSRPVSDENLRNRNK